MWDEFKFRVYHHNITLARCKAENEFRETLKWPLVEQIKIPHVWVILNNLNFLWYICKGICKKKILIFLHYVLISMICR
jgi:hypothetical protein